MKKYPAYTKQIAHIMKIFDFQRVHKHMVATEWIWVGNGVPSIQLLKKQAKYLLEAVAREDCEMFATGGFVARLDKHSKKGNGRLSLEFNVSSYEYGEEE